MATIARAGAAITADGTYDFEVIAGKRYALEVCGTWGVGSPSLSVKTLHGSTAGAEYPDSPLTADGGFEFVATSSQVRLTVSGSTTPALTVYCWPIYP